MTPLPPLPLRRDVRTELTLCLHLPAVALGSSRVAQTMNYVGSGGQQPRSRCRLTLALLRAVEKVCPISPSSLPGRCWPWWACLGLESSAFLFTPVLLCACLSLNLSFVWGQLSC